ncbi:protein phosphatase [Lachnospiraceae bacterium RM5]|nr:protein phosphatase [Lachnospiraceae bacterium RM5]
MKKKENTLIVDENNFIKISIISRIGDREEQQDSVGYFVTDNKLFVTVCDGMGGHNGGRFASKTASDNAIKMFTCNIVENDYISLLKDITIEADKKVSNLRDDEGNALNAGSTMVSIIIDNDELFWASVGDSRLYLLRKDEFIQVTVDHNYKGYLKEKLDNGQIDDEEYKKEMERGDALLSYLGLDGLELIDYNSEPFKLLSGDKLILMTDGLYKILDDLEISNIIINFKNIKECAKSLEKKLLKKSKKNKINKDNITYALINVK